MFSSVSKWLGVVDNTVEDETLAVNAEGEEKPVEKEKPESDGESKKEVENDDLISPETKKALEEASAKAISTAKDWGSYFLDMGKQASVKVTEKAKELTKTVEQKGILGDFSKEQETFLTDRREKERRSEAGVPPWVGYNEEEEMKKQILALSQDQRNFLRNPPSGIQFQFDFDAVFPVAMATLQEDKNLQKMRFELVPKQIKEDIFWRNYFYRVSLIKQSTQLTSITQQSESEEKDKRSRESSSSSENIEKVSSPERGSVKSEEEEPVVGSPGQDEFVSDTFAEAEISDEDLQKEMEMLNMENDPAENGGEDDWEQALIDEYLAMQEEGGEQPQTKPA